MKLIRLFFDRRFWCSQAGVMAACSILSLLWFDVEWCLSTTFRPMSTWMFWPVNLLAGMLLVLPILATRRMWVQVAVQVLVDLLLLANLMYCRTYFSAIPPESYALWHNLADFTDSVWDSLRWADAGFVVILAVSVGLSCRSGIVAVKPSSFRSWGAWSALLAVTVAVSLWVRGGFYEAYGKLVSACYTTTSGVPTYTVAGHLLFVGHEQRQALSPGVRDEIDRWLADQSLYCPPVSGLPQTRRSLVLLLLESFETWPVGATVGGLEITPVFNSLIADSTALYAPHVLTQVDAGRSSDAQLMVTAGLLPMEGSVFATRSPESAPLTLPRAMKEDRRAITAILSVDQQVTWNYAVTAKAYGYDIIQERSHWVADETVKQHLSDGSFFRQSVAKLDSALWPVDTAAMITLVAYSGHAPFEIPDHLRDPEFDLSGMGLDPTLENYLYAAHYTDSQLGTIVDYLRSRPDWDSTLLVITGDHEGLAASRRTIRNASAEQAALVDEGQYTPLLMLNSPVAMTYEPVMGQIDIYPTLLDLMGLSHYRWRGVGQSILDPAKIPAAISSMTGVTEGDTTGIAPARLDHWGRARRISDRIIRSGYLVSGQGS